MAAALFLRILPAGLRESFAGAVRETFVGPLIALQVQAERARGAFVSRDISATRLDSLVLRNAELRDMEQENMRLRALLGLGARLRTGFVPAEALHRPELGDAHTILVTAGTRAGVVEGSTVVAPEGLIGKVVGAQEETSTAILWTHPDFAVSAMSANGSVFGIIKPHLGEDAGRFMLELRGVAFRDSLLPGAEVRSSGLGSVFPRGIPIGTVVSDITTPGGYARTYLVRPMVMPADVTVVMVLLPAMADLSSAWTSAVADSAREAVTRAGDSLNLRPRTDTSARDTLRRRP